MAENIDRSRGRSKSYKFDRGGTPAEMGPFIGTVMNNIDPTRSGRLEVYIEAFSGGDPNNNGLWRTVNYVPPFYGLTPNTSAASGTGTFKGNQQSYGMWFTPPDIGVQVICFFVNGDPDQGYYLGCVPTPGISHMVPAIGASNKYNLANTEQEKYLSGASQLPVTEINVANEADANDPRFFDKPRPVHSVFAAELVNQGLITDTVRGPITSNSQRESPSSVFGISSPGRPIYQGGLSESDIKQQLDSGSLKPQDVKVVARRGGHSIILDDGNLEGQDNLVRIRTSKGHQITMSDDGDCFYITHANGQTWLEFGKQGTVDVYSTNSVNIRTQGTLNLHADKTINMYAGDAINIKSGKTLKMQAVDTLDIISDNKLAIFGTAEVGLLSDGSLALKCETTCGWQSGGEISLAGSKINLNSGSPAAPTKPEPLADNKLPDTKFGGSGWGPAPTEITSIVTRAPTHEPYAYHNEGTNDSVSLS